MLEFVERQVFRLTVDCQIAARPETARAFEVGRDIGRVVPVVELLLDHGRNVDAPHLQKRGGVAGLLDWPTVHREDLAVAVQEILTRDVAAGGLDPPRRWPESHAIEKGSAAQHVRRFQLIERQVFRPVVTGVRLRLLV